MENGKPIDIRREGERNREKGEGTEEESEEKEQKERERDRRTERNDQPDGQRNKQVRETSHKICYDDHKFTT